MSRKGLLGNFKIDMKMLINYKDILNLHEMFGIFEKCHQDIGPKGFVVKMMHKGAFREDLV